MKVLMYNPKKSSCNLYYRKIGSITDQITVSGDIDVHWPSMNQFLTERQRDVQVVGASFTPTVNQVCSTFLYVRKDAGDVIPTIPSQSTLIQIPGIKTKNSRFTTRSKKGEVIMSDYRVGTAEFLRCARVVDKPTMLSTMGVGRQVGWLYTLGNPNTPYGALPAPPAAPAGRYCVGADILVTYSWVTVPAGKLVLSPDLSVIDFSKLTVEKDAELVTAVLADCNNGTYDILTEALELPSTMEFLSSEFKKAVFMTCDLEDEARAMRKALPAEKFTKWFANHWLKGRYALMPIFYSIQDIAKVLEQIGREYAEYKKVSDLETEFPFALPAGLKCSDTPTTKHRCMIKSRYTTDSLLSDFRRLIAVNLATTAWELTTYSFVYDWAFNIGDFLSALTGSDGATESKCCYSQRNLGTYEVSYDTTDPILMQVKTSIGLNIYDRSVINPIDHIGLDFGLDMTWKRIIDAFALSSRPAFDRLRDLRK